MPPWHASSRQMPPRHASSRRMPIESFIPTYSARVSAILEMMTRQSIHVTSYIANSRQEANPCHLTTIARARHSTSTNSWQGLTRIPRVTLMTNHSFKTEGMTTVAKSEVVVFTPWQEGSVTISCLSAYCTIADSPRTHGLRWLTMLTFTLTTSWSPFPFLDESLLSSDMSLCTYILSLGLCLFQTMYISALVYALRTLSKFSSVPILVADELASSSSCEPRS